MDELTSEPLTREQRESRHRDQLAFRGMRDSLENIAMMRNDAMIQCKYAVEAIQSKYMRSKSSICTKCERRGNCWQVTRCVFTFIGAGILILAILAIIIFLATIFETAKKAKWLSEANEAMEENMSKLTEVYQKEIDLFEPSLETFLDEHLLRIEGILSETSDFSCSLLFSMCSSLSTYLFYLESQHWRL